MIIERYSLSYEKKYKIESQKLEFRFYSTALWGLRRICRRNARSWTRCVYTEERKQKQSYIVVRSVWRRVSRRKENPRKSRSLVLWCIQYWFCKQHKICKKRGSDPLSLNAASGIVTYQLKTSICQMVVKN